MHVVIAGGTGFLGSALTTRLRQDGHRVVVLTRRAARESEVSWAPDGNAGPWAEAVSGADAVINLAGVSIAGARWTRAHKTAIRDSRVLATRSLAAAIRIAARPPGVFLSGSGVGVYGDRGDEPLTEDAGPGRDFLAGVCREWEAAATEAVSSTRVVLLRTGVVLARDGGALPQMARPFHFFAGGPLGSGRQYVSWIIRDDWIRMVRWALVTEDVAGPLNVTAPAPVPQQEFARSLGRVLRRPSVVPTPEFALRLLLGEMAGALLLSGQRAVPARAEARGFTFQFPSLEPALREVYRQA